MERRDTPQKHQIENEDISDVLIIIPKAVFDTLLKQESPSDLISLYSFYYYTAKWQKTNQARATNKYCQQGLDMGERRFLRAKSKLLEIGLIEKVKIAGGGWYIKLTYVIKKKTLQNARTAKIRALKDRGNQGLDKCGSNALSFNNKNALSYNTKNNKKSLIDYYPPKWVQNETFHNLIIEYVQHRRQKKSSLTTIACKRLVSKMTKWSIKDACLALESTLENGYTGVFLDSTSTRKNGKPTNGLGTHNLDDTLIGTKYPTITLEEYEKKNK